MNRIKWSILRVWILLLLLTQLGGVPRLANASEGYLSFLPVVRQPCQNQIPYQPESDRAKEEETLRQINLQRSENGGLPALAGSESLTQIARFHSLDMAVHNLETHEGSAGETAWDRYTWLCEKFGAKNEMIGFGFGGDVSKMIGWWMGSVDVHRKIILDTRYTVVGVGFIHKSDSNYKTYWTVNFGSPPAAAPEAFQLLERPACTVESAVGPEGGVSVMVCE